MTTIGTRKARWALILLFATAACGAGPAVETSVHPAPGQTPPASPVDAGIDADAEAAVDAFVAPVVANAEPAQAAQEPGHAAGPCPAPSAEAKQTWARALSLSEKTTDPGPHRAMAEALRMHLDALLRHGCHRHLDDEHLTAEAALLGDDPKATASMLIVQNLGDQGIFAQYHTGYQAWIALYQWRDGKVRTRMVVTGEAGDDEKQLLPLGVLVFRMPGVSEPFLGLANSHPWPSSCWRALRFRIFAPSEDPAKPTALLDLPTSGRWCEGALVKAKDDTVSFTYDGFGGPFSIATVQRPYVVSYRYENGSFHERFGYGPKLEYLVEDWLMRPWSLSEEATVEDARSRLKPIHEKLHGTLSARRPGEDSEYTSELFPVSDDERRLVLYCAKMESGKPCAEWPKPVDVFIQRSGDVWQVKDVIPRK